MPKKQVRKDFHRKCRFESLEDRRLMAGNLFTPVDTPPCQNFRTECAHLDFGDAPDSSVGSFDYETRLVDDGARHVAVGPTLGKLRDVEADGQPSAGATRDGIDEDGVTLLPGVAIVRVTAGATDKPLLNGWIDFNQDGDWDDAGEQVFDDVPVSNGVNVLPFAGSGGLKGETYARFRLSNQAGLETTGLARDGEVEDYVYRQRWHPTIRPIRLDLARGVQWVQQQASNTPYSSQGDQDPQDDQQNEQNEQNSRRRQMQLRQRVSTLWQQATDELFGNEDFVKRLR